LSAELTQAQGFVLLLLQAASGQWAPAAPSGPLVSGREEGRAGVGALEAQEEWQGSTEGRRGSAPGVCVYSVRRFCFSLFLLEHWYFISACTPKNICRSIVMI